jgi:hypothetical protein
MQRKSNVLILAGVLGLVAGTWSLETAPPADEESHLVATPRTAPQAFPVVDLPAGWRTHNWAPYGSGSCVHASLYMLLRWQAQHELAERWKRTYHSGESYVGLRRKLDREGIRYADTTIGDVSFLEWACRTRRGAGVTVMGGAHMICLVHFDDEWAGTLDNNRPYEIRWWPREEFVRHWRDASGWAVTPLFNPVPPETW